MPPPSTSSTGSERVNSPSVVSGTMPPPSTSSTGSERVNSPSVVSGTMPPPSTSSTQRPTTTSQVIHNDQQGNKNSSKQPKKKKKVIKDIDDHVVPQVEANTTNLPTITKNKFDEINTSPPDAPVFRYTNSNKRKSTNDNNDNNNTNREHLQSNASTSDIPLIHID
ncbi:unnamed protein product [Rotaria sp. Silwood1]|nr:unnamed protein product [Rotaria sp. Silwood1]